MSNTNQLIEDFAKEMGRLRNYNKDAYHVTYGKKFAKVMENSAVCAFVDMSTLNVYKPASWQKPAPRARGNLNQWKLTGAYSDAGLDTHGYIFYLR